MTPEELLEKLAKAAAIKGYHLHADHEYIKSTIHTYTFPSIAGPEPQQASSN